MIKGPYVQNVKVDEITIMWESKTPVRGKVIFGKENISDNEVVETDSSTIHEMTLTGLEIETVYHYRVISGNTASAVLQFKTAVAPESPFSFAAYGDNKEGPFNYVKVLDLILARQPNFVIHNGDFVDRGNIYKQWQRLFFDPAQKLISTIPLFPALGNHEDQAQHYFDFFSLPNNELWYSFDFGNAHFIVLDSNEESLLDDSKQLQWLIADLEKNNATWTFVNFHHPLFSAGGDYFANQRIKRKKLLHAIFEEYGVDMVLTGHDHNYERTVPIGSKAGAKSITYVVCGNGGTPLRYVGEREWTAFARRVFGFVYIRIDGQNLHFQALNIDDEVMDEFILDKSDPESVAAYEKNRIFYEDIQDPVVASKAYRRGKSHRKAGNFAEAIGSYQTAYEADSTCISALQGLALCSEKQGDFDKAIEYAMLCIAKAPAYGKGYEALVKSYGSLKKYDDALQWCRKWQRLEPDNPNVSREIARIYKKQEKVDLAIAAMKKAIEINPAKSNLYIELGRLFEETGDQRNALIAYQTGLDWFMEKREDEDVVWASARVAEWTE